MLTAKTGARAILVLAVSGVVPGAGATPPDSTLPARLVRLRLVDLSAPLPEDLLHPEGRSRWDLTRPATGRAFTRSLSGTEEGILLRDDGDGGASSTGTQHPALDQASGPPGSSPREGSSLYKDDALAADGPAAGDAARWLYPDRFGDLMRPGARAALDFIEEAGAAADRIHAEVQTVGIGWVHLPSGAREAVLQRALLLRAREGTRGFVPDRLVHRWVDPRAGVVAEVSRPPGAGAAGAGAISEAVVLEQVLAGAATLRIYVDELDSPPFTGVSYGWDRGAGTPVSSLTPEAYATIGDLLAADAWDFSGVTSGAENASTGVPVTAAETCNVNQCGYNPNGLFPGRLLNREDKNFDNADTLRKTNAVTEREQRASDVVVWLRGGAQNEGTSGGFGQGESRFCYASDDGVTRSPVPIWRFPHQDALGWYMEPGDPAWVGGPFNCEQNIFNAVCGVGGIVPRIWSKGCTGTSGVHAGTQSGQILKGGVVTLPSGHTFNALLVRTVADFCVYAGSSCASFLKVDEVRTFVYLWQAPVVGTVARLTSAQNVADGASFTTLAETDIKFGLFPPLGIAATGATDTTVSLSWDPGRDTRRISSYKVYWGTSSGAGAPYAFDSARNPAQVAIAGTGAVVSGLSPGTTYFFTVTSLSAFRDPSTGATTLYESLLYPTQVSGDPSFVYPVEVQAATTGGTCIPAVEVSGLTAEHDGGGVRICWQPASDPCLAGYDVLGAASPESAAGFSVLAGAGLETCWSGDPPSSYFLVVARGTGGTGPWGHYGR